MVAKAQKLGSFVWEGTDRKGNKTKVLGRGEGVDGFVLVDASRDEAEFEKEGKRYTLAFKKTRQNANSKATIRQLNNHAPKASTKEIKQVGGVKVVQREALSKYTKNPKDIWKDIGITEVKNGKAITGFRVRFVRRDSAFEKLGIKRGDMLLAINGERLDSYKDAFRAYKEIESVDNLTLTIKRKNQEMELDYEIK